MERDPRFENLLSQLLLQTGTKNLSWRKVKPPADLTEATNAIIKRFFVTTYKGKKIALYEQRDQAYNPDEDLWYWCKEIKFAILDDEDEIAFEIDGDASLLYQLYSAVQEHISDIDDWLNKVNEE